MTEIYKCERTGRIFGLEKGVGEVYHDPDMFPSCLNVADPKCGCVGVMSSVEEGVV